MPNPFGAPEVTVQDVAAKREANEDFVLLDIREPEEHEVARIDGADFVPMSKLAAEQTSALPEAAQEKNAEIVTFCHHGMRSAQVTAWLAQQGWTNVSSMDGGIDAWSQQVDSSVPTY